MKQILMLLVILFSPILVRAEVVYVSMVQVLSHLQEFEGRDIGFVGFMTPKGQRVFLTKDHENINDELSSIRFNSGSPGGYGQCDYSYVNISGKVIQLQNGAYVLGGKIRMTTMDGIKCTSDGDWKKSTKYRLP